MFLKVPSSKLMPLIIYLPHILLLGQQFSHVVSSSFLQGTNHSSQSLAKKEKNKVFVFFSHLLRFNQVNIQQNSLVFCEHNSFFIQLRPFCDQEKKTTVVSYRLFTLLRG